MKLKRFLLRYEPPGVGLELEISGELSVRHKSLPAASDVTSVQHIQNLVDELVSSEPEILTRRRHRPALLQLLGRLYKIHVDVEVAEEEDQEANTGVSYLQEGRQVVLIKLQGKYVQFNGEVGSIAKAQPAKGKYEVSMSSGDIVKIRKEEHAVPVAPGAPLVNGIHVAIRGLRNHTELNGCLGRVVECHEENHRYEVRACETGQLFRVKQENLVPINSTLYPHISTHSQPLAPPAEQAILTSPAAASTAAVSSAAPPEEGQDMLEPGTIVQLTGLKTAMSFNGQSAEILSVDVLRGRYEIRLSDGGVKTIRCENVRLISHTASKSSPRPRTKPPERHG